jgi:hypothetical protein
MNNGIISMPNEVLPLLFDLITLITLALPTEEVWPFVTSVYSAKQH